MLIDSPIGGRILNSYTCVPVAHFQKNRIREMRFCEDFLGLLRPALEKLGWTDGWNIVLLEPRTGNGRERLLAD